MKTYIIEWFKPLSGGGLNEIKANSFADAEQKFKDYWDEKHVIIRIELK